MPSNAICRGKYSVVSKACGCPRAIARFLFAGGAKSTLAGKERSMPKNKIQGTIFGIIMSITMAYGMEVYNDAWTLVIPTMVGGFSNMTNDVFAGAFV